MLFLLSADFFSKSSFSKNSFRNTIRVLNSIDPDQVRHFVRPDLGLNCLHRFSADDTRFKKELKVSAGYFFMLFFRLLIFNQNQLFPNVISGIPSEC